jgi:hypothetical protein
MIMIMGKLYGEYLLYTLICVKKKRKNTYYLDDTWMRPGQKQMINPLKHIARNHTKVSIGVDRQRIIHDDTFFIRRLTSIIISAKPENPFRKKYRAQQKTTPC